MITQQELYLFQHRASWMRPGHRRIDGLFNFSIPSSRILHEDSLENNCIKEGLLYIDSHGSLRFTEKGIDMYRLLSI